MKDKLGKELKPGQRVAYAVREGDHACLRLATVVSFPKNDPHGLGNKMIVQPDPRRYSWADRDEPMKPTTISMPDRVIILTDAV